MFLDVIGAVKLILNQYQSQYKSMNKTEKILTVEPKDIYSVVGNTVYLGDDTMSKEELKSLIEEIKYLEKTRIWAILTNTVTNRAKEIMFEKSESFDDMKWGKAILWSVRQMRKIIAELKSISIS
jgi:hypothetical protein